jgi:exonuclease I
MQPEMSSKRLRASHVDFQLYDRFFGDADQKRFNIIRQAKPKESFRCTLT